jgi:GNAT superfamily N-acetyltransferase
VSIFVSPDEKPNGRILVFAWLKLIFGHKDTTAEEPLPQLEMLRDHMDDLPEVAVPMDYEMRTFQSGDEQAWCDIMEGNVGRNWTTELFAERMSSDPRFSADGLFFATYEGRPVASACAWRASVEEEVVGNVHMVGAFGEHRGKGLGHLVNAAVLNKLKKQGFQKAHLKTDDWRLPAINSYLKAGFDPLNTHISHAERWDIILERIAEYEKKQ